MSNSLFWLGVVALIFCSGLLAMLAGGPIKEMKDRYEAGLPVSITTMQAIWARRILKKHWRVIFGVPTALFAASGVFWLFGM